MRNGQMGTILGASRYQKTRDPTRSTTFQRLSLEGKFCEVRVDGVL